MIRTWLMFVCCLGLHMLKCHLYSRLTNVPVNKHIIALKVRHLENKYKNNAAIHIFVYKC